LDERTVEEVVGNAIVKQAFSLNSKEPRVAAGCEILKGTISKSNPIRVLRDKIQIWQGSIETLRHFKDEVEEVVKGKDCGIVTKDWLDVKVGDVIQSYKAREVKRKFGQGKDGKVIHQSAYQKYQQSSNY